MDALLEQARDLYEGQIDFPSQRLADNLTTALLTITGILSFLLGYLTQDIIKTLYTGLGGAALTFLVVVPPWPWYNQASERWLPARVPKRSAGTYASGVDLGGVNIEVDGKRIG
nr:hypothetical protein B0A51_03838 [Rachicladosporium sp. CCFEE 5018]